MTHQQVVTRAFRWLRGTMRCDPVFAGNASCREIPDAIGWTSRWKHRGSHVVECKTSIEDFRRDALKKFRWKDQHGYLPKWVPKKEIKERGYVKEFLPLMGHYRWYMCAEGLITAEMVEERAADHGLLWICGRSVRVIREAPKRTEFLDLESEVWYLRFAILNKHCCREVEAKETETAEQKSFVEAQGT